MRKLTEKILEVIGVTKSVKTITLPEEFFAEGKAFTYSDYTSYGLGETKKFVFDPTGYTPSPGSQGRIIALIPKVDAVAGPVTIDIFAACVVNADGTALAVFNRDSTSSNVNQSTLKLNPTVTSPGVKFSGMLNPATAVGVNGTGNSISEELPFALDITKKYCMSVTNTNGDGTLIALRFTWFEI